MEYMKETLNTKLDVMGEKIVEAIPKNISKPMIHSHVLTKPVEETKEITPNTVLTEVLLKQFVGPNSTITSLLGSKEIYPFWDQVEQSSYDAIIEHLDNTKEEAYEKSPGFLKDAAYFDKHDLAMHTWLHAIENNTLKGDEKYTIIHIDSHPDMSPVWNMSRARFRNAQYHDSNDAINIASFLLPFAYLGHVHKIVWVKAPWCGQFPVGKEILKVGLIENDDFPPTISIGTNSTSEYFNTLGGQTNLKNPVTIDLKSFVELNDYYKTKKSNDDFLKLVGQKEDGTPREVLLDLDLDYFATTNPMINTIFTTFKTREMVVFFKAFIDGKNYCSRENAEFPRHAMVNRVHWTLKSIVKYMVIFNELAEEDKEQENLMSLAEDFFGYYCKGKDQAMQMVETLYFVVEQIESAGANAMKMFYSEVLPTVLSNDTHMATMGNQLSSFLLDLKSVAGNPAFITVARSAIDDYTPVSHLEKIEKMSYDLLNAVYRDNHAFVAPKEGYEREFEFVYNDDWDARVNNQREFFDAIENIQLSRAPNFDTSLINTTYLDLFT
eukprot:CAMPEP_0117422558 /NCGR_PEP_ID=MMETSP0758-20121206/3371_1 /TAXON_ID=63605 /ORGANISM="Percolomonas cosmopolitus, Strain AE-1 (ATCC 50343)" /LENGTH=550 /DNA_ID=CAMNT_0005205245 /DNA_START=180 /DNA_END=1830 /DNA_ORIENTATION=+